MGAWGKRRGGALDIQVQGLSEAIDGLKRIDAELPKELKKGLREDARPLLESARGYALALGGTGQYASNMAMRTRSSGVRVANADPGAGAIEFARRGAFYLTGPRAGRPLGVPGGEPPRALVRAAVEQGDAVVERAERRVSETIERYLHG